MRRGRQGAGGAGDGVGGDVRLPDLSGDDALLLAEFWILPLASRRILLLLLQAVSSRTNLEGAKLAKKFHFFADGFCIIDYNDISSVEK